MNKSIFEKIINNESPSFKIYEDDVYIAILDIKPLQKGHTLLIPKIKNIDILEEPNEIKQSMLITASKIAKELKNKLGASGIKYLFNIGESAGQVVFHTHMHIIPYYDVDTPAINDENVFKEIIK